MFIISVLVLLFCVTSYDCKFNSTIKTDVDIVEIDTLEDLILCRNCGEEISAANYLISVASPLSLKTFNEPLFSKNYVLVQILANDILTFSVVTASHSSCITTGEWEHHDSWFPGYRWKFCLCPVCGEYIGWLFDPVGTSQNSKPFFGFILSTLVADSTIQSLIKYPYIGGSD